MKALKAAMALLDRSYGRNSVMLMGEAPPAGPIEVVSSGSLGLDRALGVGGLPRGRIIEIFGPESSGKTTLALHAVAEAQRTGGLAAFIDAEHALDLAYAKALGVKEDLLVVSQPDTGDEALDIADKLIASRSVDVIVIDSVAALVPKAEFEGTIGDASIGLQARLMSQSLRKLAGQIAKSNTIVIFLNQLRMKIGMGGNSHGPLETTSGGNALKFYASIRLDVRPSKMVEDPLVKGQPIGRRTTVRVVKNKVARPFRQTQFIMVFGEGIGRRMEILEMGVEAGLLKKNGAWYEYEGQKIGQGLRNAADWLRGHSEAERKLDAEIRKSFERLPGENTVPEEGETEDDAIEPIAAAA